jgi:hypothetical protein
VRREITPGQAAKNWKKKHRSKINAEKEMHVAVSKMSWKLLVVVIIIIIVSV